MSRTRSTILVVVGIIAGSLMLPPAFAAGTKAVQDVFVTNDATSPVPVTGSVSVSGPVTVAEPVAVNGQVQVADNREPFEVRVDLTLSEGSFNTSSNFQVPAGKRLVVEFVSASVVVPNGQTPLLSANASTGAVGFPIPLQLQGVGNNKAFYIGAIDALDFAGAGFYFVELERQNPNGGAVPGTGGGFVYISGYLLPV